MFKNRFLFFSIFVFLWAPFIYSQDATINLVDRGLGSYQDVFVSDLDFLSLGEAKDLFAIELTKSIDGRMTGQITITLAKDGEILATVVSNIFNFPEQQSTQPWFFNNVVFASSGGYDFEGLPGSTPVEIDDGSLSDENAVNDLVNDITATNKIPFGVYQLEAVLRYTATPLTNPIDGVDVADQIIIINITNPYTLSQISPGNTLNSGFVYELFTQNPVFQWNGNSDNYQIVVFKKGTDFSSTEDILNSQPVWESERLSTLFAQYPETDAVPLEYGAEYVWQVRSFVSTTSGENIIQSEMWEFTIVDPSTTGTTEGSMAKQEFEALLRQLLGGNAEQIIQELGNFKLSMIRVNGQILSIPEFYKILEKYRDQENEIFDIFLRSSN